MSPKFIAGVWAGVASQVAFDAVESMTQHPPTAGPLVLFAIVVATGALALVYGVKPGKV